MSEVVLVTEREFEKNRALFTAVTEWQVRSAPDEETALAAAVLRHGCRAVIVGVTPYRGPLYEALGRTGGPGGALLARHGVGHANINKELARQHRIVVTNTPGVLEASVAEHALWLMGSLAKHIPELDRRVRNGEFPAEPGSELCGKTLVIVGFGAIGRRLARMAYFGLGLHVLAADVLSAAELEKALGMPLDRLKAETGVAEYTSDLKTALTQADIVSLHASETAATRHLIRRETLALLKPSALLVNTARGMLVDEEALYDALAAGRLAGAALDVFEEEPYQPRSPERDLRKLPNVVLTPHAASNTREANSRMAEACLRNVAAFFAGRMDELTRVA